MQFKTYYNGRSYTNNGITFVQNDDGSITVSGVATADAQYTLFTRSTDWGINIDVGKSYVLSGCPSGGSNDTYRLVFGDTQSSAYHRLAIDIGEGTEFTITSASEQYYASSIDVRNGVDLTTPITFYPMLRPASDTDSTYQPYAKTNQELTAENEALTNQANDMVNELGAKNLIPYPYSRPSGYTNYGMTATYDEDGVITVNKTTDSVTAYFALYSDTLSPNVPIFLEPNKNYILSLELENATDVSVFINDGNADIAFIRHISTGKYEYSFTTPTTLDSLTMGLYWIADATETNAKVKPMIRLASITDDTYVPYAMTNRELTKELTVETGDITRLVSFSAVTAHGVRKYGKIVELYFAGTLSEAVNTWTDFLTVPEGFRPSHYVQIVSFNTYSSCKNLQLASSGGIQSGSSLASGDFIRFAATYIIN